MSDNNIPDSYKPISMWGYFGYEVLFSIPIIGFIFLLIFSFAHSNVNVKNFARSYFCYLILMIIIFAILAGTGMMASLIS